MSIYLVGSAACSNKQQALHNDIKYILKIIKCHKQSMWTTAAIFILLKFKGRLPMISVLDNIKN